MSLYRYLIVAQMLPSSLNCRNQVGYCSQTKHSCLSVPLKTGSTKKIKSIVGCYCCCCLFLLFWLIQLLITIFSLNPVQFFGSVAFVCLFSSAFVSLFSLCASVLCLLFFLIKNLSHVLMQALKLYFPVILFITDVHYI